MYITPISLLISTLNAAAHLSGVIRRFRHISRFTWEEVQCSLCKGALSLRL